MLRLGTVYHSRLSLEICEAEIQSETSGCECHGNQSKQEVCMDPPRAGAAEFHTVLKKYNTMSLEKRSVCVWRQLWAPSAST